MSAFPLQGDGMNKYDNVDYCQIDKWVKVQPWSDSTKKNRRTIIARAMSLVNCGLTPQQAYDEITRGISYGAYVASTLEPFFARHGYGTIMRTDRSKFDMGQNIDLQQKRNHMLHGKPDNVRVTKSTQDGIHLASSADDDSDLQRSQKHGQNPKKAANLVTHLEVTPRLGRLRQVQHKRQQDGIDATRSKIVSVLQGYPDGLRIFDMMEADVGAVDNITLSYIARHLTGD